MRSTRAPSAITAASAVKTRILSLIHISMGGETIATEVNEALAK